MVADLPENYLFHTDAFQFIKEVGVDWDDTKIMEAEPGDYITIARKEKGTQNWYVGSITGKNKRNMSIPLTFLEDGQKYEATIYRDADNADWENNPEAYLIEHRIVTSKAVLTISLARSGGAAISLHPLTDNVAKKEINE
jgi:hypothetical protein